MRTDCDIVVVPDLGRHLLISDVLLLGEEEEEDEGDVRLFPPLL